MDCFFKHRLKESGSLIASFVDDTMRDMTKSESSLTIKSSPSVTPITLGMLARPTASKSALLQPQDVTHSMARF